MEQPSSISVAELLKRLNAGDNSAAEFVFRRFSGQLIGLVEGKLGWKFRRKMDPEDVVQSAFRSFFRMQAESEMHFENWDALWGLLSLMTIRKCGHRIEHFHAACRNLDNEQSKLASPVDSDASWAGWEAVTREPTPSQAAMLAETIEELLKPMDERDRRIVRLALEGYTPVEISGEIRRSERTVQRVLERLKAELLRRCQAEQNE